HRLGRVLLAAAEAVADAGRPAAGRAQVLAEAARIGDARIDGPARAPAPRLRARHTAALARDVAAHAVGAEARGAVIVLAALRALHLQAAASVDALLAGRAVARLRARLEARALGRVARERRADRR